MDASAVLQVLREAVPQASLEDASAIDMPAIYVDREHLVSVCRVLRDDPSLQFALLADVTAADYLPAASRFEVVYHLACLGERVCDRPGGATAAAAAQGACPW